MNPDKYDQIVDACLPELRHEIRKLDGRTGRAMRRKKAREIAIENIESTATSDICDKLDALIDIGQIKRNLSEKAQIVLDLRMMGYTIQEIAGKTGVSRKTVFRFFREIHK